VLKTKRTLVLLLAIRASPIFGQSVITTLAGGNRTFAADGEPASSLAISAVSFVALDLQGNPVFAIPELNVVVRVDPDGTIRRLAGTGASGFAGDGGPATSASLRGPVGVAYDSSGTLYITDARNNRVRKVTPSGIISTFAGGGNLSYSVNQVSATDAALNYPTSVVADPIDNSVYINDSADRVIRKVANNVISTYAGTGNCAPPSDGQLATKADLCEAEGMALDAHQNLYFADLFLNCIRRVDFPTQLINTVAGTGVRGSAPDGSIAASSPLQQPGGVAIDSSGFLYIAETGGELIRRVSGGVLATVAGSGTFGYSGDGRMATTVNLNSPFGIVLDSKGNLYLADRDNFRIRKVDTTSQITTIAGNGSSSLTRVTAPSDLSLAVPFGVSNGPGGTLYVSDTQNNVVRAIQPAGTFTFAGTGAVQSSGDGKQATSAGLINPLNVTFDSLGNAYVVEVGANKIRKVAANGTISTFAGDGVARFNGDSLPASQASLNSPTAVAVDANDSVYIADYMNHRVRKVSQGVITTVAGTGSPGFSGDQGAGIAAQLNGPLGLALDSSGNVYISDSNNRRIRKLQRDGTITTFGGGGQLPRAQAEGGPAVNAQLNFVQGLATDTLGNLYFADANDNVVRMITPGGILSTIAGNGTAGSAGDGSDPKLASLRSPSSVAIDKISGNIFIADKDNDRIRLVYTSAPSFKADVNSLLFSASSQGLATPTQTVNVTGSISGLFFTEDASPADWLSVTAIPLVDSSIAQLPARLEVTADPANLAPGRYSGKIVITSARANPPARTIEVQFDVADRQPAVLKPELNKLAFSFSAQSSATSQAFRVGNSGGGIAAFQVGAETINGGSWLAAASDKSTATSSTPASISVTANPAGLSSGTYAGAITLTNKAGGDVQNVAVTMTIADTPQTMRLSQSGLTFRAVAGGGTPPSQSFEVLNTGGGGLTWSTSVLIPGGGLSWLTVSPSAGTSVAGSAPPSVSVAVNPGGLAAGIYYAQVVVSSSSAINSPQLSTVVLDLRTPEQDPGPIVQPSGLFFTARAGGIDPPAQMFSISNLSRSALVFGSSRTFVPQGSWFVHAPINSSVEPGQPLSIQVQPLIGGLAAGIYRGVITLAFSDGSVSTVLIRLVVAPAGGVGVSSRRGGTSNCVPAQWVPLFTTLPNSFTSSTGWPTTLVAKVFDDCLNPMVTGTVTVSFSNGDRALPLFPLGDGRWSGTWPAVNTPVGNTTLTATAVTNAPHIQGEVSISGAVRQNADPPIIFPGGIAGAGRTNAQSPLAQGSLISIFGTQLSNSVVQAVAFPLETHLQDVEVAVGTKQLPLAYAGPGQINAILPYDVAVDTSQSLVVRRGSKLSAVMDIQVSTAGVSIFPVGSQAGTVVDVNGNLNGPENPAHSGDTLVVYCTGLGPVTGGVTAGSAAPSDPLATALNPVSVTIGQRPARVTFSGLTPGYAGLYQINVLVPEGILSSDAVPLLITEKDLSSVPVTIAIR
jgi:uncharacterized protein (TIGR03437 family)